MKLIDVFTKNLASRQKQYEAVRAVAFGEASVEGSAEHFGYSPIYLRALIKKVSRGTVRLFPEVKRGPRGKQMTKETMDDIVRLRRERRLSSREITKELKDRGIRISVRTVERYLLDAGFPKLRRRTFKERGISRKGTIIQKRALNIEPLKMQPFEADCQVAGVFFFLPYIMESGILDVVSECGLPESGGIGKLQAALSMLLLKLIGSERLSHIKEYDSDLGFGLFAGLSRLPKPTYMCSYSCRTQESTLLYFQKRLIDMFGKTCPELYQGKTVNLDFHTIPHFGDESQMEKVWSGTRNKALKGANTFFAQDGDSGSILYTRADIKRSESSEEIRNFVNFRGIMDETLVFDSKLTRYDILYELNEANIKFITLKRKSDKIIENTAKIEESEWQKVYLPIPKRKHKYIKVHQNYTPLIKGKKAFRQLIIKDHGRSTPTYIITNNEKHSIKEILTIYAKRWHIENKLSELVKFFNLNALSSPIMIRIHFDILWTIIADTLYHLFAKDLKRFENCKANSIFRKFIDMPGKISFDGQSLTLKIRKRASTPILMGIDKLKNKIYIPWLGLHLKIIWIP